MYQGNNYINGEFIGITHNKFLSQNPSVEVVYGEFPLNNSDVQTAVVAARDAQAKWSRESRVQRAELFDRLAQLIKRDHQKLQETISIETGKNLNESHAEVVEALHMCQFVAATGRQAYGEMFGSELPTKDAYVIRKPRGVVGVISPWNFPLAVGSFWCAAPAILEGNAVVHKPSELTPMVNDLVSKLYHEAGFPRGVFNLVHGDGSTGKLLVESDVDVILFTGSAEVAKEIKLRCAHHDAKTCSVEAGSKSAMMVLEDNKDSLDLAVDACLASCFKLSGQRCVSSGRIIVNRSFVDKFIDLFVDKIKEKVIVGDPFEHRNSENFVYGPLISHEHLQKVSAYNDLVRRDHDAVVLYDKENRSRCGYFLNPMVYKCEWGFKKFLKEEVFGPHVAIIPVDDLDEAIRVYNDTDYGLSLGVISDDFRVHREIVNRCTSGMIYINGTSIGAESHLPFSSWKKSGYGTSAAGTWKAVTHTTAVTVNYQRGKLQFAQGLK